MYNNINSRIVTQDGNSAYFPCNKGVHQGENLSPILFSFFLNDLEAFLLAKGANGIVCEANTDNIHTYINSFSSSSQIIQSYSAIVKKIYNICLTYSNGIATNWS